MTHPAHQFADHHQAGVAAQPHGQRHSVLFSEHGVELPDGLHNPEPRAHGSLCVVLVGTGIAEVNKQTVAKIIGDVTVEAGDHLFARLVERPHDLAPLFGVELTGHRR